MGKKILYDANTGYIPNVTIVMATYNEEDIIKRKIKNIQEIDYPKDKVEIIVVDSSTDSTRKIVRDWIETADIKVRLIEEESRKGLATALNMGYAAATGEVVIKNDVDILVAPQSIREIVKYFADPQVGAVTGALQITNASSTEIGYKSLYAQLRLSESNLDSTYIFEPFSAFRKTAIVPISTTSVADDCELALNIRKNGFKTVYSPTAIAYDNSPTKISQRLHQKSRRAQGHIRLILQNLDTLFNRKYGKFGSIVFPANFFMMILSPWFILALVPLGLLFLSELFGLIPAAISILLLVMSAIAMYVTSTPQALAGFIESQIALIVASFKLAVKGPDFMWTKETRTTV